MEEKTVSFEVGLTPKNFQELEELEEKENVDINTLINYAVEYMLKPHNFKRVWKSHFSITKFKK